MAIYLKKFDNHTQYENYINGSGAILPNVSICTTEGDVHYNPYVDPCASEIVKTTYEWVEIGGIKWATKNVGAKTITDFGINAISHMGAKSLLTPLGTSARRRTQGF